MTAGFVGRPDGWRLADARRLNNGDVHLRVEAVQVNWQVPSPAAPLMAVLRVPDDAARELRRVLAAAFDEEPAA